MRIVDSATLPWTSPGKPGLAMKTVRRDDAAGHFLGLIAFEPLVATGLHQHRGAAFSYLLAGGLTDHAGTARAGEVGINFFGSTHDAVAYSASLMVSRLEGPVVYGADIDHALHAGARPGAIGNGCPDMPPDLNIALESIAPAPTWVPGVSRRLVHDYLATGDDRRLVDFHLLPGATVPQHRLRGAVDVFVIAGDLHVGGSAGTGTATGGGFVTAGPGEEMAWRSTCGAHLLAWAEGPADWLDAPNGPDFYGFGASYASARAANR